MLGQAIACAVLMLLCAEGVAAASAQTLSLDDTPGRPGEWGFRPSDRAASAVNPPGFVWRPQEGAVSYELQCSRDGEFGSVAYSVDGLAYNCHCPPSTLEPGTYYWRFRFADGEGGMSAWSRARSFTVSDDAAALPLPSRDDLLARIPRGHPRLFLRPEDVTTMRERASGDLKGIYDNLVAQCEELLKDPPPTEEPPTYPPEMETGGEEWREMWWGNRVYTSRLLNSAATLAFTRLIGGKEEYGQLARRLLMAAAEWDPKGSTGYRYNDEAGMPYNYYFSRTYTFVYDLLSEQEREKCREVMAVRGKEMYEHLCPRHLWRPYASHSNRAWHFLGEVGIAFLDEIPEAEDWVWFAMNVFRNMYPVWCDDDGGWHEGINYWAGYMGKFTWWADVMCAATGIDAYSKPYFSQVGYYPMYLQPPGTKGGGFGDLTARRDSRRNVPLMQVFASQAGNPHWQWYVDAHGGAAQDNSYVGFVRGALPQLEPKAPSDLPSSRCFWGVGQACLNTNPMDARDNVEVIFKSSPFGTQSHGYESQNSFLLYAFGERLLIRTGRRDMYGSPHHKDWMWETKSTNCITVNGKGQAKHTAAAAGRILAFHTSEGLDYVAGEAGPAYGETLDMFTRHVVFVKPGLILIYDELKAPEPSAFEWLLHAPTEMLVDGQEDIRVVNGGAACEVSFLVPDSLDVMQTNRFNPPPRPRIKLVEWHLTARSAEPARTREFLTVIRPHRTTEEPVPMPTWQKVDGGYAVESATTTGSALVLLRSDDEAAVQYAGISVAADVAVVLKDASGAIRDALIVRGGDVRTGAKAVAELRATQR